MKEAGGEDERKDPGIRIWGKKIHDILHKVYKRGCLHRMMGTKKNSMSSRD